MREDIFARCRTDAAVGIVGMSFFVFASLILLCMQAVIGLWIYFLFPAAGWKVPAVLLPIVFTAAMRLAMNYTRTHYGTLENILYFVSYGYAGLVFLLFFIVLAFALLQAICALLHLPAKHILGPVSLDCMALTAILSIYGACTQPRIKHIDVHIPGAPEMTAVLISDTHLGMGVSLKRWEKALSCIQEQNPDTLWILGDIFEYGANRSAYAQALANVQTKYGSFGVLGNHEYYTGYENSLEFYRQAGIETLQNQIHTLPNGLQLIGLNDIRTARVSAQQLDDLLAQTNPARTRVILSHQPLLTLVAAQHRVPLMVSGHTHNGQIFPFNFFVRMTYPYVYGLYQTGPQSHIYVTSGMFYWGVPLRFFAPAEIPILHIKGHA